MKVILEINRSDISPVFDGSNFKAHQLIKLNFDGEIRQNWNSYDEIWYTDENNIRKRVK